MLTEKQCISRAEPSISGDNQHVSFMIAHCSKKSQGFATIQEKVTLGSG
jgi:hypothetical protein